VVVYVALRIHATVTGVLLAFVIPFGNTKTLPHLFCNIFCINRLVFYFSFALANTAIVVSSNIGETIAQHYSIGIALGLIVGKPLGIYLFWPYP
jgi:NhaA family Na+:H+ antiporter